MTPTVPNILVLGLSISRQLKFSRRKKDCTLRYGSQKLPAVQNVYLFHVSCKIQDHSTWSFFYMLAPYVNEYTQIGIHKTVQSSSSALNCCPTLRLDQVRYLFCPIDCNYISHIKLNTPMYADGSCTNEYQTMHILASTPHVTAGHKQDLPLALITYDSMLVCTIFVDHYNMQKDDKKTPVWRM